MFLRILLTFSTEKTDTTLPDSQNLIRKAVSQVLVKLMSASVDHLGATDVELILNTLTLTVIPQSGESKRQRLIVQWIMEEVCSLM